MNGDAFIFVKPGKSSQLDSKAIGKVFKADKRVLPVLQTMVDIGEEQLKALTGYDSSHLPKLTKVERPTYTFDSIGFDLTTTVSRLNPQYDKMLTDMMKFLDDVHRGWRYGINKGFVVTDEVQHGKKVREEPFMRWDVLMYYAMTYNDRYTNLKVTNKIETAAPGDLNTMPLDRLAVPVEVVADFNIKNPGTAKIWYLARRFCDEVNTELKAGVKEKMQEKVAEVVEEMPSETRQYLEQFANYLYKVQIVPSQRPVSGEVYKRLFAIPEKVRQKGDRTLPVIAGPDNYLELLNAYAPTLEQGLEKWATLDGNIGELVVFYYGIEDDARVKREFPHVKRYLAQRDMPFEKVKLESPTLVQRYIKNMWVSLTAVMDRMQGLDEDHTIDRVMIKHTIEKL